MFVGLCWIIKLVIKCLSQKLFKKMKTSQQAQGCFVLENYYSHAKFDHAIILIRNRLQLIIIKQMFHVIITETHYEITNRTNRNFSDIQYLISCDAYMKISISKIPFPTPTYYSNKSHNLIL